MARTHLRSQSTGRRVALALVGGGALIATTAIALPATAGPARMLTVFNQSQPSTISGNATLACRTATGNQTAIGYKIDRTPIDGIFTRGDFSVTLDVNGNAFTFTGATPDVIAVIVKGGANAGGDTNAYVYTGGAVDADDVPLTTSNDQGISHVTFCVPGGGGTVTLQDLAVQKTAVTSSTRTVDWGLTKTVDDDAHTGVAGSIAGTSTYTVTASKSEDVDDFTVTGTITVENPNATPVDFTVTDALNDDPVTMGVVDCGPNTVGAQAFGTVAGATNAVCTYIASPDDASATLNTAMVTSTTPMVNGGTAMAEVAWGTPTLSGFDVVDVEDSYNGGSAETIGTAMDLGPTVFTYPRTFTCPPNSDPSYANGTSVITYPNVARIKQTGDMDDASVTVTCKQMWKGETATGSGVKPGTKGNWFMVTECCDPAMLIAGQRFDAGDITFAAVPGGTAITITLNDGFRFAAVGSNVKVNGFGSFPTAYGSPGKFPHKQTVPQTSSSTTITVPTSAFYAIHVDVERLV